jgi:hypothetical protein
MSWRVCCTDRLSCSAKASSNVVRTARHVSLKSRSAVRYRHVAVSAVARMRSATSGRVVYSSLRNPANAECDDEDDEIAHSSADRELIALALHRRRMRLGAP